MTSATSITAVDTTTPLRVQPLSESGIRSLPTSYIQAPSHRPTHRSSSSTSIPVIDLASPSDPLPSLRRACSEWGAFQVINHGVPARLLLDMQAVTMRFFQSEMKEKLKYACDAGSAATEGYGTRMLAKDVGVLDWRDYFDHHTLPERRCDPGRWPDFPPNYREVVLEYSMNMRDLAQRLLCMISSSLGLPPTYIEKMVGEVYQNITASYYSPCPQPELALGLQAHSDIGAITLLLQDDVGGLEVWKDGEWVLAKPLSDALVVILADQTEIITNGEYISAVHRAVVNEHRARLSVSTFYDPPKTSKIFPAPELCSEQSPCKFREVLYGDYVSSWYTKGPEGKRNLDALLIP